MSKRKAKCGGDGKPRRKRGTCVLCKMRRHVCKDGRCAFCAGARHARCAKAGLPMACPSHALIAHYADRAAKGLPLWGDDEGRFRTLIASV